jgi:hypothetical protein
VSVRVEIDSCALRFETDCSPALERLDRMLEATFSDAYYEYSVSAVRPHERLPTLRYVDAEEWRAEYEPETATCIFTAPWHDIGETTVLAMWLFYLSELVRQERREYLLHASALERGGRAIVLAGPSESGKTIGALELCLGYGFRLFANNRIKVGLRDGTPRLLRGDPVFNLRSSSLRRYSEVFGRLVFGSLRSDEPEPTQKRRIPPGALGIEIAESAPEIAVLVLLALDAEAADLPAERIGSEIRSREAFRAVAALYEEMSSRVRGTAFIPVALAPGSQDFFVPSLDRPDFVTARMAFLDALFSESAVLKIRGSLDHAVTEMLRFF